MTWTRTQCQALPCREPRDGRAMRAAREAAIPPLTPYLAVLAQDADRMGERIGMFPEGTDPAGWQRISRRRWLLSRGAQIREIESSHPGRVVYAGGDICWRWYLASARSALRGLSTTCSAPTTRLTAYQQPSASTAIVFFHASWPLQSAIASAQEILEGAKERDRPGLGILVLSRGGERTRLLPWKDRAPVPAVPMIEHLQALTAAFSGPLSGRLGSGLEGRRGTGRTEPRLAAPRTDAPRNPPWHRGGTGPGRWPPSRGAEHGTAGGWGRR